MNDHPAYDHTPHRSSHSTRAGALPRYYSSRILPLGITSSIRLTSKATVVTRHFGPRAPGHRNVVTPAHTTPVPLHQESASLSGITSAIIASSSASYCSMSNPRSLLPFIVLQLHLLVGRPPTLNCGKRKVLPLSTPQSTSTTQHRTRYMSDGKPLNRNTCVSYWSRY